MKVSQLIEQLQYMDKDAEVHFAYGYGDHWRTTVAPKVSQVFEGAVVFSDYHRMDKMVEMDDENCYDEEPGNPDENVRRVVIIE
jgi:hypothetical protein